LFDTVWKLPLLVPGHPDPVPSTGGLPAYDGELGDIATEVVPITVPEDDPPKNVVPDRLIDAMV
jgi:hypothetical protein